MHVRMADGQALSVLYPDCAPGALNTPVCHKVNQRLGLVRITFYVRAVHRPPPA